MWPFLFILALVPMFFYWSDSVSSVFPALASYFPEKKPVDVVAPGQAPQATAKGSDTSWFESTEGGYVAWLRSLDENYRLAAGCREGGQAVLQVTEVASGQALDVPLVLNFQYGALSLASGVYAGPELVGAIAQFQDIYLQSPTGVVYAQFQATQSNSGAIARTLTQMCHNE